MTSMVQFLLIQNDSAVAHLLHLRESMGIPCQFVHAVSFVV